MMADMMRKRSGKILVIKKDEFEYEVHQRSGVFMVVAIVIVVVVVLLFFEVITPVYWH